MGTLNIKDLLEDLKDDGITVSEGSFTLDASKAEEKLRGFAFTSTHHYLLKLIQCAVANGAQEVKVQVRSTKIQIEFDGETICEDDTKAVLGYLLNEVKDPKKRYLRHLAAGLRGAEAVNPNRVVFDFWNGKSRFQRVWDESGWKLSSSEAKVAPGRHRFMLSRTLGQSISAAGHEILAALGARDVQDSEEESTVFGHTGFSPARVTLDGKILSPASFGKPRYRGYEIKNDPNPGESKPPPYLVSEDLVDGLLDKGHHLVELCCRAEEGEPASLAVCDSQATIRLGALPGEEVRCRAWLAVRADLGPSQITYVEDGVTLCTSSPMLACPGLVGVYSTEGLTKDLTGFKLVEDEAYRAHFEWLYARSLELRQVLQDSLALFPIRERVRAALSGEK